MLLRRRPLVRIRGSPAGGWRALLVRSRRAPRPRDTDPGVFDSSQKLYLGRVGTLVDRYECGTSAVRVQSCRVRSPLWCRSRVRFSYRRVTRTYLADSWYLEPPSEDLTPRVQTQAAKDVPK